MKNKKKIKISTVSAVFAALVCLLLSAASAFSWEAQGVIYGTDIEYSMLSVSKGGVRVRFTNTYEADVKISLRLTFYDKTGNTIGYSIFGLREIPGSTYLDVGNNHLNGNWKACKNAQRIEWQRMTYEPIY